MASSIQVTPLQNTVYTLQANAIGNCIYTHTLQLNVNACLNLTDLEEDKITISPIPADEYVQIHFGIKQNTHLEKYSYLIYDSWGTLKSFNENVNSTQTICTQNLESGIYFLIIQNQDQKLLSFSFLVNHSN